MRRCRKVVGTKKAAQLATATNSTELRRFSDEETHALGVNPLLRQIEQRKKPCYVTDEDRGLLRLTGKRATYLLSENNKSS